MATDSATTTTGLPASDWEEFRQQRPQWSPDPDLGDGVESAVIEVPMDYANPGGERINVAISRRRATDRAHRRGVLVSVHGGPGGNNGLGRRLPGELAQNTPLNEVYDLVGLDPRGTGASTRLDAEDTPAEAPFDSRPPDSMFETIVADMKAREEGCRRIGGTLRPHVSTNNICRDIDVIRSVLGEEKISFVGYAYGTLVGAIYGAMFGQHLDRSVLDSCVHPDWDWRQQFMSQAVAVRENVDAWAEWVGEHDETYGLGTGAAAVLSSVEDLTNRLAEGSDQAWMRTSFDGIIGRRAPLRPDWDGVARLVVDLRAAMAAGDTDQARELLAGTNTWQAASAVGDDREAHTREAVLEAVTCETDWPSDPTSYFEDMRRFRQDYPYGFGLMRAQPWVGTFRSFTPPEPRVEVRREGYPPGLVVQADADPVDYHEGGRAMAARLDHRLVLVEDSGEHELYALGDNAAVDEYVNRYLLEGDLPDGDVVCPGPRRPDVSAG
jgi:pimeloyl-ACP methyl ester carboxylesterase